MNIEDIDDIADMVGAFAAKEALFSLPGDYSLPKFFDREAFEEAMQCAVANVIESYLVPNELNDDRRYL